MEIEKKIFLEPKDDVEKVSRYLRDTTATTVILNIPRDSVLGKSVTNFELLKNEVKNSGKEVYIESVDEHILQLGAVTGFKVFNPVFRQREKRVVADILPRSRLKIQSTEILLSRQQPKSESEQEPKPKPKPKPEFLISPKPVRQFKPVTTKRWFLKIGAVLILVIILAAAAFIFLPRAEIKIIFRREVVNFNKTIEARKDVFETEVKDDNILLPAELLTAVKNLEIRFPATGREYLELKAKGKLTVYNAYSSSPQTLVASTRFLSPQGKIFRLDKQVTVPGAKVRGGKIQPSSITVEVTADKPGEDYNLEPTEEIWRIPGFQGTDKYNGFYARATEPFKGGFVGERVVPTEEDLIKAKTIMEDSLKNALKSQMLVVENDLKFLKEATFFKILKTEIDKVLDKDNQFGVFMEAEMRQIGFDEEMLKKILIDDLKKSLQANLGYDLKSEKIEFKYEEIKADGEKGVVSFKVKGQVSFVPSFDKENLRQQIVGLSEEELRKKIYELPGLEKARIVFWPFWVHRVPFQKERVLIIVE